MARLFKILLHSVDGANLAVAAKSSDLHAFGSWKVLKEALLPWTLPSEALKL